MINKRQLSIDGQNLSMLGKLSAVYLESITDDNNLEYLKYLTNICEHQSINYFWHSKQTLDNKRKLLTIYQLSIKYEAYMNKTVNEQIKNIKQRLRLKKQELYNQNNGIILHRSHINNLKKQYKKAKLSISQNKYLSKINKLDLFLKEERQKSYEELLYISMYRYQPICHIPTQLYPQYQSVSQVYIPHDEKKTQIHNKDKTKHQYFEQNNSSPTYQPHKMNEYQNQRCYHHQKRQQQQFLANRASYSQKASNKEIIFQPTQHKAIEHRQQSKQKQQPNQIIDSEENSKIQQSKISEKGQKIINIQNLQNVQEVNLQKDKESLQYQSGYNDEEQVPHLDSFANLRLAIKSTNLHSTLLKQPKPIQQYQNTFDDLNIPSTFLRKGQQKIQKEEDQIKQDTPNNDFKPKRVPLYQKLKNKQPDVKNTDLFTSNIGDLVTSNIGDLATPTFEMIQKDINLFHFSNGDEKVQTIDNNQESISIKEQVIQKNNLYNSNMGNICAKSHLLSKIKQESDEIQQLKALEHSINIKSPEFQQKENQKNLISQVEVISNGFLNLSQKNQNNDCSAKNDQFNLAKDLVIDQNVLKVNEMQLKKKIKQVIKKPLSKIQTKKQVISLQNLIAKEIFQKMQKRQEDIGDWKDVYEFYDKIIKQQKIRLIEKIQENVYMVKK